jgi:acyl carrier protein
MKAMIGADVEPALNSLREKIFALLFEATDESLNGADISSETEFTETGMSSIEYLKFVDKIESAFGVIIDLEADGNLNTVDKFLKVLLKQGVSA